MKYVAYYRVSTKKQGESGHGLQAQKDTIKRFIQAEDKIIKEFTEVESGKKNNRTELLKAIDYAKNKQATLLISKLDRISRNITFIFSLRDSGIDFVVADMPQINTLTLGIYASLAQYERELISERTKKALAAKRKSENWTPGTPANLTNDSRQKAKIAKKENALNNENNKKAFALAKSLREQGISYHKIAARLNEFNFKTRTNKSFFANSVRQLLTTLSCFL